MAASNDVLLMKKVDVYMHVLVPISGVTMKNIWKDIASAFSMSCKGHHSFLFFSIAYKPFHTGHELTSEELLSFPS